MSEKTTPAIEGYDVNSYYGDNFTQPEETKDYIMQQVMMRIKNPKASLDFYTKVLGFTLVHHSDFPAWGFSGKRQCFTLR